jgi:hypothetical protein
MAKCSVMKRNAVTDLAVEFNDSIIANFFVVINILMREYFFTAMKSKTHLFDEQVDSSIMQWPAVTILFGATKKPEQSPALG